MLAIRVIDEFTELADVLAPFDDAAFLRWDEGQSKVVGGEVESGDVTGALGFTPEDAGNKATGFSTVNNTLYPSVAAVKAYADALVVGLLDDRGNYDASVNAFPSSGGSGTAGAILKGDMWFISVAGTLGGAAVGVGDQVRALVDTPGQTAGNWAISEANIGFVPENVNNKATGFGTLNNVLYPTTAAVAAYAQPLSARLSEFAAIGSALQIPRVNAAGTAIEYAAPPSAGANAALSNLAAVAINAALIPATSLDIGSSGSRWSNGWFTGRLEAEFIRAMEGSSSKVALHRGAAIAGGGFVALAIANTGEIVYGSGGDSESGFDVALRRIDTGVWAVLGSGTGASIELNEMTAPGTPAANRARLYLEDSGGKTRLMIKYDDGTTDQISIQP